MEGSPYPLSGRGYERYEDYEAVEAMAKVYERWHRRKNMDPRIRTLSGVLAPGLRKNPKLRDAAGFMVAIHQHPEVFSGNAGSQRPDYRVQGSARPLPFPEYGANLLMRGLWNEWRHMGVGWPKGFVSPEKCEEGIFLVTHDSEHYDSFSENIAFRSVQTSVPDRIIGAKLALAAVKERFTDENEKPRPLRVVSVGHGLGVAEKKLMLNRPFDDLRFYNYIDFNSEYIGLHSQASSRLRDRANSPLEIDSIFAIDVMPSDNDPATRDWMMGAYTPDEQMNKKFMAEVEELDSNSPPGYVSLRGDFSSEEGFNAVKTAAGEKPVDFVWFSTVFYQLPEIERNVMLGHAADLLGPGGLIGFQDFVQVRNIINESSGETTQHLSFPGDWKNWMYQLVIIDDPKKNGWNFEPKIFYKNGRAHDIYIPHRYREELLGSTI